MRSEELYALLKEKIDTRDTSHAYLFVGPEGIGKQQLALRLCAYAEGKEWGNPPPLLQDAFIVGQSETEEESTEEEEKKEGTGIDMVRQIIMFLHKKPTLSPYRCVMMGDMSAMTPQAQHATLKILEEPPEHSLLFGVARAEDALLDTIVSRCSRIMVTPVGEDEALDFASKYGKISKSDARTITTDAQGRIRWIQERLDDPARYQTVAELAKKCLAVKTTNAINALLEELARKSDEDTRLVHDVLREMTRVAQQDPVMQVKQLQAISSTLFFMGSLQTNIRAQLKALLFAIANA